MLKKKLRFTYLFKQKLEGIQRFPYNNVTPRMIRAERFAAMGPEVGERSPVLHHSGRLGQS